MVTESLKFPEIHVFGFTRLPKSRFYPLNCIHSDFAAGVSQFYPWHLDAPFYVSESMIEIVFVVVLCKLIGKKLVAKNRKAWPFQLMLVVGWFGGEFVAGFIAGIVHAIQNGPNAPIGTGIYLLAIVGALVGTGFTFLVVHLLPPNAPPSMISSEAEDPFGANPNAAKRYPSDPTNPYAP